MLSGEKKKRRSYIHKTEAQLKALEAEFESNPLATTQELGQLATTIELPVSTVKDWFKMKRKVVPMKFSRAVKVMQVRPINSGPDEGEHFSVFKFHVLPTTLPASVEPPMPLPPQEQLEGVFYGAVASQKISSRGVDSPSTTYGN